MRYSLWRSIPICAALLFGAEALAQQPPPPPAPLQPPYGAPITLEQAKKIATVAEAEVKKQPQPLAVAIVEPNGGLVYYFRIDGTNYASLEIAVRKARSAAMFRAPTQAFFNVNQSNAFFSTLHPAAVASPGGIPIVIDGKIVGGFGVSGFPTGALDHAMAEAILAAAR